MAAAFRCATAPPSATPATARRRRRDGEHAAGIRDFTGSWSIGGHLEQGTYALMCRAVGTLLLPAGPKQKEALREARSCARAALEIAKAERVDIWLTGVQHSSLAAPRLTRGSSDGPRRNGYRAAALSTQPLLRIEAPAARAPPPRREPAEARKCSPRPRRRRSARGTSAAARPRRGGRTVVGFVFCCVILPPGRFKCAGSLE